MKNVAQCPLTIGIHKKKPPTLGRQITTHFDACWGFCKNDFFLKKQWVMDICLNFFLYALASTNLFISEMTLVTFMCPRAELTGVSTQG